MLLALQHFSANGQPIFQNNKEKGDVITIIFKNTILQHAETSNKTFKKEILTVLACNAKIYSICNFVLLILRKVRCAESRFLDACKSFLNFFPRFSKQISVERSIVF